MDRERITANPVVMGPAMSVTRGRLAICAYHGVGDPSGFRAHLEWLLRHRAPVSLADVERAAVTGTPLSRPSFLVTFDDGRRSVFERGLPVLESLGVPAALFVVAGLIGTEQPYWWNEVEQLSSTGGRTSVSNASGMLLASALKQVPDAERRRALGELRESSASGPNPYRHLTPAELIELESRGVAIGSHSLTHPCLDRCSPEESVYELRESRERLEGWLGHDVRSLAYPNGNVDSPVEAAAARAGYDLGLLFDHRLSRNPPANPLRVSRVRVDTADSLDRFKGIVSGVSPLVLGLRGRR